MLGVTDKAPVNSVEVLVVNADDELEPLRNTEGAVVELQVEPNVGDAPMRRPAGASVFEWTIERGLRYPRSDMTIT